LRLGTGQDGAGNGKRQHDGDREETSHPSHNHLLARGRTEKFTRRGRRRTNTTQQTGRPRPGAAVGSAHANPASSLFVSEPQCPYRNDRPGQEQSRFSPYTPDVSVRDDVPGDEDDLPFEALGGSFGHLLVNRLYAN